tara:strand:- start:78 stop:908 length:831 start_codon:yes stop_codon:yes gene_type:complete
VEVVGFSGAGCKIAKHFEKYPQYNVHYVDVDIFGENCYSLPKATTMEDAEEKVPIFSELQKAVSNKKTFFICAGGGRTSGASLRILEQIRNAELNIVYIRPDLSFLNEEEKKREKIVYNVLQEFARSGLFEKIFILENTKIAEILGDLSIVEYFSRINKIIVNSLHMINYLSNAKSIIGNISAPRDENRISTIAVYNMEKSEESVFFDLENTREKHFYFALNHQTLEKEKNMLKKIKEQVKKSRQSDLTSVSYDITSTTYETNFAYVVLYTNFIQE